MITFPLSDFPKLITLSKLRTTALNIENLNIPTTVNSFKVLGPLQTIPWEIELQKIISSYSVPSTMEEAQLSR